MMFLPIWLRVRLRPPHHVYYFNKDVAVNNTVALDDSINQRGSMPVSFHMMRLLGKEGKRHRNAVRAGFYHLRTVEQKQ